MNDGYPQQVIDDMNYLLQSYQNEIERLQRQKAEILAALYAAQAEAKALREFIDKREVMKEKP